MPGLINIFVQLREFIITCIVYALIINKIEFSGSRSMLDFFLRDAQKNGDAQKMLNKDAQNFIRDAEQ